MSRNVSTQTRGSWYNGHGPTAVAPGWWFVWRSNLRGNIKRVGIAYCIIVFFLVLSSRFFMVLEENPFGSMKVEPG